jgi:hypothetical protein
MLALEPQQLHRQHQCRGAWAWLKCSPDNVHKVALWAAPLPPEVVSSQWMWFPVGWKLTPDFQ